MFQIPISVIQELMVHLLVVPVYHDVYKKSAERDEDATGGDVIVRSEGDLSVLDEG